MAHQLVKAGILIEEGSLSHVRECELGAWAQWGTAATYYHLASRTRDSDTFLTFAEDAIRLQAKEAPPAPYLPAREDAVALPAPLEMQTSLAAVLRHRRTTRQFADEPLDQARLATLLHWVAGVQYEVRLGRSGVSLLKANPSGGARHPVEVYPVVRDVAGVDPEVYHYAPDRHVLERVAATPSDEQLVHWCGGQSYAARAPVLLLYTAVLERAAWKYPMGRTYRALLLDLGHVSQTAYLVGTALNLGVFFTAAIRDEAVERALGLDWTAEIPLGVTGIGVTAQREAARQQAMLDGGAPGFSEPESGWGSP